MYSDLRWHSEILLNRSVAFIEQNATPNHRQTKKWTKANWAKKKSKYSPRSKIPGCPTGMTNGSELQMIKKARLRKVYLETSVYILSLTEEVMGIRWAQYPGNGLVFRWWRPLVLCSEFWDESKRRYNLTLNINFYLELRAILPTLILRHWMNKWMISWILTMSCTWQALVLYICSLDYC